MSDLRTAALELVEEAWALVDEIDEFQSPPSPPQIDAVQGRMNILQRLLNRVHPASRWLIPPSEGLPRLR